MPTEQILLADLPTKSVTLTPLRATVTRDIHACIKPHQTDLTILGLDPRVDSNSIRIQGSGPATITDIQTGVVPRIDDKSLDVSDSESSASSLSSDESDPDDDVEDEALRKINEDIAYAERNLARARALKQVGSSVMEMLDAYGKRLAPESAGSEQVARFLALYEDQALLRARRHREGVEEEESADRRIDRLEEKRERMRKRLSRGRESVAKEKKRRRARKESLRAQRARERAFRAEKKRALSTDWVRKVVVSLDRHVVPLGSRGDETPTAGKADKEMEIALQLSYVVELAKWSPRYELSIDTPAKTARLTYRAEFVNATSETWKDAHVTLSTSQAAFSRPDEPLPALVPWQIRLHEAAGDASSKKHPSWDRLLRSSAEDSHKVKPGPHRTSPPRFGAMQAQQQAVRQAQTALPAAGMVRQQQQQMLASGPQLETQVTQREMQRRQEALVQRQQEVLAAARMPAQQLLSSAVEPTDPQQQTRPNPLDGPLHVATDSAAPAGGSGSGRGSWFGRMSQNRGFGPPSPAAPGAASGAVSSLVGSVRESRGFVPPPTAPPPASTAPSPTPTQSATELDILYNDGDDNDDHPPSTLDHQSSIKHDFGLTTTYDLPGRRTLTPSNEPRRHVLADLQLQNVQLSHLVVPKHRAAAFLRARIQNTSAVTLLRGPVGMAVDATFLGTSSVPPTAPGEYFGVSMGVDPGVVVRYAPPRVRRLGAASVFFAKDEMALFTRACVLKNAKTTAVEVTLLEQVPVSEDERLKVRVVTPAGLEKEGDKATVAMEEESGSGGVSLGKNGEVRFVVTLRPGKEVKLVLEYEASAPSGSEVGV